MATGNVIVLYAVKRINCFPYSKLNGLTKNQLREHVQVSCRRSFLVALGVGEGAHADIPRTVAI